MKKEEQEELKRLRKEVQNRKKALDELAIDHKLSQMVIQKADELMDTNLKGKYEEELAKNRNKN